MSLRETVSQYWQTFQHGLFPWLAEELGPLSERNKRLVQVLELVRVEDWLPGQCVRGRGRPQESRAALARAFLAKVVFDVPTTRALVERLRHDPQLRRLCGWERAGALPGEATFSRAFAEFAASELPGQLHAALVERNLEGHLAGHVSRERAAAAKPNAPSRPCSLTSR